MSTASCSPFREWEDKTFPPITLELCPVCGIVERSDAPHEDCEEADNFGYDYWYQEPDDQGGQINVLFPKKLIEDSMEEYPYWVDETDPFEVAVYKAKMDEAQLLLRKHRDYGPKNISMSPGGPLNGLSVRLWDKIARLFNLKDQDSDAQFESLEDTAMDIANYGTIAGLVVRGEWPG